jgi:hypothetical protein
MLPRASGAPNKAKKRIVDDAGSVALEASSASSAAQAAALSLLESSGDEQALEKLVTECRERVDNG